MQCTYRPALRIPPSWLDPSAPAGEPVPVPFIDEDEATLAVAAARPLLERARLAPSQLRRVAITAATGTGVAAPVALALGVPIERVEESAAILYGQTHHPAPGEGPVLSIHVAAPRPGATGPDGKVPIAGATARLLGPGIVESPETVVKVRPWSLDRDAVQGLARWEREAPTRATMGAYVPKGTWDRAAAARCRFEAAVCDKGHVEFPPRPRCGQCGGTVRIEGLPTPGTLETFTVVSQGGGPSEFEPLMAIQGDYAVGVARFGKARVPGIFTETPLGSLAIGQSVEPVFRRLYAQDGEWRYGLKFRLPPA